MLKVYVFKTGRSDTFTWKIYATNRRKANRELKNSIEEYVLKYGSSCDPVKLEAIKHDFKLVDCYPNKA